MSQRIQKRKRVVIGADNNECMQREEDLAMFFYPPMGKTHRTGA